MENTIEAKAKFFAQYWGQRVLSDLTNGGDRIIYPIENSNMYRIEESYLELKSIELITEEDLNKTMYACAEMILEQGMFLDGKTTDILRSLGYALHWIELSVQEQLEYGWIKIKD